MKTAFLAITVFIMSLWAQVSMASTGTISCHTPRMNKVFTMTQDKVVFEEELSASRNLIKTFLLRL